MSSVFTANRKHVHGGSKVAATMEDAERQLGFQLWPKQHENSAELCEGSRHIRLSAHPLIPPVQENMTRVTNLPFSRVILDVICAGIGWVGSVPTSATA